MQFPRRRATITTAIALLLAGLSGLTQQPAAAAPPLPDMPEQPVSTGTPWSGWVAEQWTESNPGVGASPVSAQLQLADWAWWAYDENGDNGSCEASWWNRYTFMGNAFPNDNPFPNRWYPAGVIEGAGTESCSASYWWDPDGDIGTPNEVSCNMSLTASYDIDKEPAAEDSYPTLYHLDEEQDPGFAGWHFYIQHYSAVSWNVQLNDPCGQVHVTPTELLVQLWADDSTGHYTPDDLAPGMTLAGSQDSYGADGWDAHHHASWSMTYNGDTAPVADFTTEAPNGNSNSVALTATDNSPTATFEWSTDGTGPTTGRAVTHNFGAPGLYWVTLTVRDGGLIDQTTEQVAVNPVALYAPTVVLHPEEDRYPFNPDDFIKHSTLAWSHDRACPDHVLDRTISSAKLGNGDYRHRRAKDTTCRHTGKKRYRSNQLTAPRDHRSALPAGEKLEGMYLNLDNDYYDGTRNLDAVPMAYEYKDQTYLTYWIFYAFNHWTGPPNLPLVERHEGDWEHITIRLREHNLASDVAYYQHYCQPEEFTWDEMVAGFGTGTGTGLDDETHPIVFPALGGHASYWKPGTWVAGEGETACGKGEMIEDETVDGGDEWRPWEGAGFVNARTKSWYRFGGLWGRVGAAGKLYSSGILGPSKWKFDDPKVPVVPETWQ